MKNKWAFLVGIDDYEHLEQLKYAGDDATLLGEKLRDICGFDPPEVISKKQVAKFPPTNTEIMEQLVQFTQRSKPHDTFLFYFAGHGCIIDDRTYLLGIKARSGNEFVLRTGSILLDDVAKLISGIPAEQKIIICDCCRDRLERTRSANSHNTLTETMKKSFQRAQRTIEGRPQEDGIRPTKSAVILACSPNEFSLEPDSLEHGVFTLSLAEALSEAGDGDIDLHAVFNAASIKTKARSHQRMNPLLLSEIHEPIVLGHRQSGGSPQDRVRPHIEIVVETLKHAGKLVEIRDFLLKQTDLNHSERKQLESIQAEIEDRFQFCFTTRERARDVAAWIRFLTRPEKAATDEVGNGEQLRQWLAVTLLRPDLAKLVDRLVEPEESLWRELQELAWKANVTNSDLLSSLQLLAAKARESLNSAEALINSGQKKLAQEVLDKVGEYDPRSKRIKHLRILANRTIVPPDGWGKLVREAKVLLDAGCLNEGISLLKQAYYAQQMPAVLFKEFNGPRSMGSPEIRVDRGIEYVLVPGGPMAIELHGSQSFRVVALNSFWISRQLVSVATYQWAMDGSLPPYSPQSNPNWAIDTKPVVEASWDDAESCCRAVGAYLPTEAQWEYARRFAQGIDWNNMSEWCKDAFAKRSEAPPDIDPIPDERPNASRVIRIGSDLIGRLRAGKPRSHHSETLGFRCIRLNL